MPNNFRKRENNRLRLSSIVARLPMYRFLDESQAILLKLEPAWNQWFKQTFPNMVKSSAHLSSIDAQCHSTLTVCADNSTTAAMLKHQQESMLTALNRSPAGKTIQQIKIRIDPAAAMQVSQHHRKLTEANAPQAPHKGPNKEAPNKEAPSKEAISSIESLQKSIKNPDLAETLGNLAETLKKLS